MAETCDQCCWSRPIAGRFAEILGYKAKQYDYDWQHRHFSTRARSMQHASRSGIRLSGYHGAVLTSDSTGAGFTYFDNAPGTPVAMPDRSFVRWDRISHCMPCQRPLLNECPHCEDLKVYPYYCLQFLFL